MRELVWQVGPQSGLKRETLLRYKKMFECEHINDNPEEKLYFHSTTCVGGCDYECNGKHGFDIAEDINALTGDLK